LIDRHLTDQDVVDIHTIAPETYESPATLVEVEDELNMPPANARVLSHSQKRLVPSLLALSLLRRLLFVWLGRLAL